MLREEKKIKKKWSDARARKTKKQTRFAPRKTNENDSVFRFLVRKR